MTRLRRQPEQKSKKPFTMTQLYHYKSACLCPCGWNGHATEEQLCISSVYSFSVPGNSCLCSLSMKQAGSKVSVLYRCQTFLYRDSLFDAYYPCFRILNYFPETYLSFIFSQNTIFKKCSFIAVLFSEPININQNFRSCSIHFTVNIFPHRVQIKFSHKQRGLPNIDIIFD